MESLTNQLSIDCNGCFSPRPRWGDVDSNVKIGKYYLTSFVGLSTAKPIDASNESHERLLFHELAHSFGIKSESFTIPFLSNIFYDYTINSTLNSEINRFRLNLYNDDSEIEQNYPQIFKVRAGAYKY